MPKPIRGERMPVLFLSGPFRGANTWEIEQNIRGAEEVALKIWSYKIACFCPHTNTRFFTGALGPDDETFLHGDLEILRRCDVVFILPGWENSTGATIEVEEAKAAGIPVVSTYLQLSDWLSEWKEGMKDKEVKENEIWGQ